MANENIVIDFTVNSQQLESAIDLLEKLGQVDKRTADEFRNATKAYNERTQSINAQSAAIENEAKSLNDLNQVAKKSMEGILNASNAELVEGALLGIQDALDEVGMSAKDLAGAPAQSLRGITKEIKGLQAEAARLESKGDLLGAEKALKQAGKLQDKIGDLRAATKAYASDTRKLDAAVQSITAVASAYQAAQGAAVLLGGSSKEFEKTLLKLNAVMAITNGLQQIQTLLQKESALSQGVLIPLQKAWTAALGETAGAARLLRGALIATGIGALVVLIGTLVANWKEFVKTIETTFPAMTKVFDFFKNFKAYVLGTVAASIESFKVLGEIIKDLFTLDWTELEKDWKEGYARIGKAGMQAFNDQVKKSALEASIKERKFRLDLLEAQGKDVLRARIKLAKDELTLIKDNEDEYRAKLIEIERMRTELRMREVKRAAYAELIAQRELSEKIDQEERIRLNKKRDAYIASAQSDFDIAAKSVQDRLDLEMYLYQKEKDLAKQKADDEKQKQEMLKNFTIDTASEISQAIFQINTQRRQAELELALSTLEAEKEKALANKRLTDKKRAQIEEEFRKKEAAIKTDAFKKDQQARVTEAVIAGALAVVKALPNYVLAAAAAVTTAAQIDVIKSQPIPKFAKGVERLSGAGTETSDSIPAMLSKGERVVPARINSDYFPALSAIHNGKVSPEFANAVMTMPEYIGLDNKSATLLAASKNTLDYKELSRMLASELKDTNEDVVNTLRDGIYVKNIRDLKSNINHDIRRK